MEKTAHRPQRIAADEVDLAVEEALKRIGQANELTKEELDVVNGGLPALAGFFPTEQQDY